MKVVHKLFTLIRSHVLHNLNYRPMDKFLKDYFDDSHRLIGVEIGVASGFHASDMLHHLPIEKLYLIDPYLNYDEYKLSHDFNQCSLGTKKLLRCFDEKVVFIREMSEDAAGMTPDNLDFVYIDGNHEYEFVKNDIQLYYPKIKPGGVIGGHDFGCHYPGVPRAVLEFCDKMNLELFGDEYDWWIVKTKEK